MSQAASDSARTAARRSARRSAPRPCAGCRRRPSARGRSFVAGSRAHAADEHVVHARGLRRAREVDDAHARRAARAARAPAPARARPRSRSRRPRGGRRAPARARTSPAPAGRAARGSCASPRGSSPPPRTPRPRYVQSPRRSWSSTRSASSRSIDCLPAPETDWYVATRTLRRPAASCSGLSATISWIVEQFGTAITPLCSTARSPFTSGTTSGTSGFIRHADDLSIATAPPRTACGTSSSDADAPIAKKQTSRPPDCERLGRRFLDCACRRARAGRARRREVAHVVPVLQQLAQDAADRARRAERRRR